MINIPKKRKPLTKFLKKYYEIINDSDIQEVWKDIILGEIPLYQISNLGRVRRKDNKYIINPFHSYRKDEDGKNIYEKPTYLRVQLYYYEDGKRKKKHLEISRLVAQYFIPIPKKYLELGYTMDTLQVNHIEGGYNIYNNFYTNLEWCTGPENVMKAHQTGLCHVKKGESHHSTFINENDVVNICECIEKGFNVEKSYKELYDSMSHISFDKFKHCFYNIKYKKSWKYISQHFNF